MKAFIRISLVVGLTYAAVSFSGQGSAAISVRELRAAVTALVGAQPSVMLTTTFVRDVKQIIGDTTINTELEELLQIGNLQEVVWRLREVGFADRAQQLEKLLATVLQDEEIVTLDTQTRNRGYNLLHVVTFANGMQGAFDHKPYDWMKNDVALYHLDRLIGLDVVPLTASRKFTDVFVDEQLARESEFGALRLYTPVANADEIASLIVTRRKLGIDVSYQKIVQQLDYPRDGYYRIDVDRTYGDYESFVPDIHPKIRTLQFLTSDASLGHAGNYVFPLRGRSLAVNGEYAFKVGTDASAPSIEKAHVAALHEHPQDYFGDADFIARLEKITPKQLEESLFPAFKEDTECIKTGEFSRICTGLQQRIALFVDVVGGKNTTGDN